MSVSYRKPTPSIWQLLSRNWALYLTLLPTIALIVIFAYWPTVSGFAESLYSSTSSDARVFVGLDNYRTLAEDTVFWKAFVNALWYFLFTITVGWAVPFVAAELLISLSSAKLQYLFRTLLILPMAFPAAVFGFIWSFMYDPNEGVINTFLSAIGAGGLARRSAHRASVADDGRLPYRIAFGWWRLTVPADAGRVAEHPPGNF